MTSLRTNISAAVASDSDISDAEVDALFAGLIKGENLDLLSEVLKSKNEQHKKIVAYIISEIDPSNSTELVDFLLSLLLQEDDFVRRSCWRAFLGFSHFDPRLIPIASGDLDSSSWAIRAYALFYLMNYAREHPVEFLQSFDERVIFGKCTDRKHFPEHDIRDNKLSIKQFQELPRPLQALHLIKLSAKRKESLLAKFQFRRKLERSKFDVSDVLDWMN